MRNLNLSLSWQDAAGVTRTLNLQVPDARDELHALEQALERLRGVQQSQAPAPISEPSAPA